MFRGEINWLDESNETEFVFNKTDSFVTLEKQIEENKIILDVYRANKGDEVHKQIEGVQFFLNGMSALGFEDKNAKHKVPPFTENIKEVDMMLIDAFLDAQNRMFFMLQRDPYLTIDKMEYSHRELTKNNENLTEDCKGIIRNANSDEINIGFFTPIEGAKVRRCLGEAVTNFGYVNEGDDVETFFVRLAKFHAQLVRIQPFMDGNKRIAFLSTNALLAIHGYPIIGLCSSKEENEKYMSALKTAIIGRDVTSLAELFAEKVKEQQDKIADAIAYKEIKHEYEKTTNGAIIENNINIESQERKK